ncbi:MAG TPA: ectoine/hydroxyectoine ABC transporter permease subunit EhuC, partial [Acidimicrobiaceae bacterium]|nr:ectoine/hydroxyectoine ABC transporter permease subunit EhuC [Acidimicrobiaceae bacterium]
MDSWLLDSGQYELIWEGALVTLQILAYSFLLGLALSLVVGVARLSTRQWVRGVAFAYVEVARGISSIVLLFVIAIAVPILFEIEQQSLILLASIALGINMGGYGAEIVRGSIQAIPKGQTEATIALNLSPTQRLRHVILPQAMRLILPPMGNLTIEILKGTALVSLIGVTDIMQATRLINQQRLFTQSAADLTVLYVNVLLIYFLLSQIIAGLFRLAERRVESRYRGGEAEVPDTPNQP